MTTQLRKHRRGQVLVMVTFALIAMTGMLGLVVDLGWSYFVRKSAQSAADVAAIAAARRAYDLTGRSSSPTAYSCGAGGIVTCTVGPSDCPAVGAGNNLSAACLYAQQHGFTTAGRQRVTVDAGDQLRSIADPCGQGGSIIYRPPTTGCVDTLYWVTVRVSEQIPQLFSAILGNTLGVVSARATAAVALHGLPGALFLTGRGEPWNPTTGGPTQPGTTLDVNGSPTLVVPPGINIASPGNSDSTGYAGHIQGTGDVVANMTNIRGGYDIQGNNATWENPPTTGMSDSPLFQDPYTNYGQPPLTDQPLTARPVFGGSLNATVCGGSCPPGNYFAATTVGSRVVATGDPVVITGDVTFSNGGNNAFGDYHFFGGLQIAGTTVTFGPGRYVIAGVNNENRPLLNNDNNAMLLSSGPNGSDAGRIFILTDTRYPGLSPHVQAIQNVAQLAWPGPIVDGAPSLYYSLSSIKSGNNASSRVELFGLNKLNAASLPSETNIAGRQLADFALAPVNGQGAGVLIWQDQGNSYVDYDEYGRVEYGTCTLNNPCMNQAPEPHDADTSPQLEIVASPSANLQGVIYQPRGAWSLVQADGDYTGAIRIVTGAMRFQGSGTLTMTGVGSPFTVYVTALIE